MSDDETTVLRFYISPSWDATSYVAYVKAPDDWADMTEENRRDFLADEAHTWMESKIEYGAEVYDPATKYNPWETGGSPDEVEELF